MVFHSQESIFHDQESLVHGGGYPEDLLLGQEQDPLLGLEVDLVLGREKIFFLVVGPWSLSLVLGPIYTGGEVSIPHTSNRLWVLNCGQN